MNYLSGALRYVAGADEEPQNLVPRLVDRIKTSALPHDRRNAIIQLTDAAKESPQRQAQVGELSLKILHAILDQDAEYDETVLSTLELLIVLCGTLEVSNSPQRDQFLRDTRRVASTNIDVYLGLPNALPLVLQSLDKHDFHIKFNAIEFLAAMAANSRQTLQAAVLETPQGVSRICDLLEDSQHQIRANSVLLLSSLCDDSSEICKIAVFSGAIGKLFALTDPILSSQPPQLLSNSTSITDDDDGTSVEEVILIQDVLSSVSTLISGTPSTQTFFRDAGCVPRLVSILQRLIYDASLDRPGLKGDHSTPTTRVQTASEVQARRGLYTALTCLAGLVSGSGEESFLIRNDFANSTVLKILVSIAFASPADELQTNQPSGPLLQLRIGGFKTISCFVREHDGFRSLFNSSTFTVTPNSVPVTPQVTTLGIMMGETSSAARLAAFYILRDSFVADSTRNIPSTSIITAMTNTGVSSKNSLEGTKNLSHGSLPSGLGLSNVSDTMSYICDSLKCAIIGWPADAAPVDVFYASRFFCWLLNNGESARERLLGSHVNGGSLLPQIIRSLGKCERDSGPSEVCVSLFTVVCVWLYQSPQAVSVFLSSAMNLPMVVDIIKRRQTNSNEPHILIRGLAAVLLGVCLWVADTSAVAHPDGEFVSGDGVRPNVIPRQIIEDIIRSRVGVTDFTSCLDDLRSTSFFTADMSEKHIWKFVEQKALQEGLDGHCSLNGDVGHHFWFHEAIISVVNDIYSHVRSRAIDLMDGPSLSDFDHAGDVSFPNGHDIAKPRSVEQENRMIADSAKDEVLQSYKEFIRSQDESLNAARLEIEEISAALRKAQSELDSKAHVSVDPRSTDAFLSIQAECEDLRSQKEDLEALLQEKISDFEAVSNALAALEDDQTNRSEKSPVEGSALFSDQLTKLHTDNEVLRQSLESEMQKNIELSHNIAAMNDSLHRKDVEINAVIKEQDAMRQSTQPDVSEALSWRSRAEVAESSLHSKSVAFQSLQENYLTMQEHVIALERSRDEALAKVHTMKDSLDEKGEELEMLQRDRARGLVPNSTADREAEELRKKLESALETLKEKEQEFENRSLERSGGSTKRDPEYDTLIEKADALKLELADAKRILSQWQQRAESLDSQCSAKDQELLKFQALTRQLDEKLSAEIQSANSHRNRATELEQQCVELDELRQKNEDEIISLRKELELRTEQSIILSGQVYEVEETKATLESELQKLRRDFERDVVRSETETPNEDSAVGDINAVERDLRQKLASATLELESAKEALTESREKESKSCALAQDIDNAVARTMTLEETVNQLKAENQRLLIEVNSSKDSLLSLGEAEAAKKVLTMQVFELQKALEEKVALETKTEPSHLISKEIELSANVDELQRLLEIRDSRLKEVENSLTNYRSNEALWTQEKESYENQILEKSSMLDSLQRERDLLRDDISRLRGKLVAEQGNNSTNLKALEYELKTKADDCDDFKRQLDTLSKVLITKDEESRALQAGSETVIADYKKRLHNAEETYRDIADQLKVSETACWKVKEEVHALQSLNEDLNAALDAAKKLMETVQSRSKSDLIRANIEHVVSSIVASAATEISLLSSGNALERALLAKIALEDISNTLSAERQALKEMKEERDNALSTHAALINRIDELNKDLELQKEAAFDKQSDSAQSSGIGALSQTTEADALTCSPKADDDLDVDTAVFSHQVDETNANPSSHDNAKMQKRIRELEDALRDAARTVSSTNTELLAAQALLVELSSDKTTMRSTLSSAEQRILELEQQISENCGREVVNVSDQDGTLSDVSDIDAGEADVPPRQSDGGHETILLGGRVKAAQLEGETLRLILKRSIDEANMAGTLLSSVLAKTDEVETRFASCQAEIRELKESEQKLLAEVGQLRSELVKNRREADEMLSSVQKERSDLVESHVIEMEALSVSKSHEMESLKKVVEEREKNIKVLLDDLNKVHEELGQARVNWSHEKETVVAQHNDQLHILKLEVVRLKEELSQTKSAWESEKLQLVAQHNDEFRRQETETAKREAAWISEKDELTKNYVVCQLEKSKATERLDLERGAWEVEKAKLLQKLEFDLEQHTLKTTITADALKKQLQDREAQCINLKAEKERVKEELEDVSSKLDETMERCEKLEELRNETAKRTTELENEITSLLEENSTCEVRVQSLNKVIDDKHATFIKQKLEYERILQDERERWKTESREYEEEIERSSQAFETVERKLRDSEAALNLELEQAHIKNEEVQKKLRMETSALQEYKRKLDESRVREAEVLKVLEKETAMFSEDRERLTLELKSLQEELSRLVAVQNELGKKLQVAEDHVSILKQKQADELERRGILEDENQEFARNVEFLEQRCKRVDNALKEKNEANQQLQSLRSDLEIKLKVESDRAKVLEQRVKDFEDQLHNSSVVNQRLRGDLEVTQKELREAEEQCASWSRDNEDLREWVEELQKKAVDLQAVANDFEEVEQSLRETINAQQQCEEQIGSLEGDLRGVREELRQKETRLRKAEREKATLEELTKSHERKSNDLEQRLIEIRETSVAKLSVSEAGVRAQAKRCAELETALAQAERQIAEFGTSADEAFAAKGEVRQLKDEATRLRDRCRDAEALTEQLESELQKMKDETEALRRDSGEGQLRALEAEHNELLVYLADLELELTGLREGTEQGSR